MRCEAKPELSVARFYVRHTAHVRHQIPMSYACATCGNTHENWPPDLAFQRPDAVWALQKTERARRCNENDDLCELRVAWWGRRRCFIRGVLLLPVIEVNDKWGIGIWAEVSGREFDSYVEAFDQDARARPRFPGLIANDVKGLTSAVIGVKIEVQLNDASSRPNFWFPADVAHPLATMQRDGIKNADIHAILEKSAPSLLAGTGA